MKKNDPIQVRAEKLPSFSLEDSAIMQWLSEYGKYLLWATLGFVALILLFYRFSSTDSSKAAADYIIAERNFVKISTDADSQDSLAELKAILQNHPELQPKYDGLLAQILIARGDTSSATPFAIRALKRTQKENSPFYTSYAETTLLISEKKFEEALGQAKELQQLLRTEQHTTKLFAFNLLRIASLQRQLGLSEQEQQTWKEWQALAQTNPTIAMPLQNHFTEGKMTLIDYIQTRVQ